MKNELIIKKKKKGNLSLNFKKLILQIKSKNISVDDIIFK